LCTRKNGELGKGLFITLEYFSLETHTKIHQGTIPATTQCPWQIIQRCKIYGGGRDIVPSNLFMVIIIWSYHQRCTSSTGALACVLAFPISIMERLHIDGKHMCNIMRGKE